MSSVTRRVLHKTTWCYFGNRLADRFIRSPEAVKEEIMTDINDLVQDFWTTSSDGSSVEVPFKFFAMRHLHLILEAVYYPFEVCFDIISFL